MNLFSIAPLYLLSIRILSTLDYLMLPVFLLVLVAIFYAIQNSRYKGSVVAKYFIPALLFRFMGALLTGLMYQYYYGYGDTFYYFLGVTDIYKTFLSNPLTGLEMIFMPYESYSSEANNALTYHLLFRQSSSELVMKTGGFFSIFTFGSYLGVSLFMTSFAFVGCWMLYRVIQDLFPHLHFPLALAILFVPSLCFWWTGLMKDSLALGGLGMFVYGLYFLFYKQSRGLALPIMALFIGLYFIAIIKIYIAIAILPAALVWLALLYRDKIANPTFRVLAGPFLLLFGAVFGLFALQQIGNVSEKFALENMVMEAAKTQWWLTVSTDRDGGTSYTLSTIEPKIFGILKVVPEAINVALYRPYPWEARKVIVLPSAAEALFSLFFTFYVFFRVGIIGTLREVFRNPTVLFWLIFSIIFAFAVGFTSMNFGALARYKIPAFPFFFSALVILLDSRNNKKRADGYK